MPPAPAERRFPLQALLDETGLDEARLRKLVNCSGLIWKEARERGCTLSEADRWAVRAGIHPVFVWRHLWLGEYAEHESEVTAA